MLRLFSTLPPAFGNWEHRSNLFWSHGKQRPRGDLWREQCGLLLSGRGWEDGRYRCLVEEKQSALFTLPCLDVSHYPIPDINLDFYLDAFILFSFFSFFGLAPLSASAMRSKAGRMFICLN